MSDLASEIKQFMDSMRDPPKSAVRTSTKSPSKHRKHNHYTMGHIGYNPKLARLQNHDKRGGRKK